MRKRYYEDRMDKCKEYLMSKSSSDSSDESDDKRPA